MNTFAFDTYRFVKHLTESGFTEQQAEALAEEQTAILDGNLATKADLDKLEPPSMPTSSWSRPILSPSNGQSGLC